MSWDIIKGQWKQMKGKVQAEWGHLTDDDHDKIAGNKEQLVGKLQERYGWAKRDAEIKVDAWLDKHEPASTKRT